MPVKMSVRAATKLAAERHKRKLTAADITKARKLLVEVDEIKNQISAKRDELRQKFSDIEDILSSADTAIDYIENGKRDIEHGIDKLSEYL